MYETTARLPKQRETEKGFFKSLSFLQKHYGLQLDNYRRLPYPYNILRSTNALEKALRTFGRSRELEVGHHEGQVSLTVSEQLRNHYDLYYIPVSPLYDLWRQPEQQATAQLLTAVFAYLYVEAGLCYYRDEDTYLHYHYEILEEWVAEDDDAEAKEIRQQCLDNGKIKGDFIQEKIMNKALLKSMEQLIFSFQPATVYQQEALNIARKTLAVWRSFPGMNIYQNLSVETEDEEDYGYNSTIRMDEYAGFISSNSDALSDDLFQMVENDFNERVNLQQPEIITAFDEPQAPYTDTLAYAEQVFKIIDELVTLLNQQP